MLMCIFLSFPLLILISPSFSAFLYHLFSSSSLLSLGLYHLASSIRAHLKSPATYAARPYHPLPSSVHPRLRPLQLYLSLLCLLLAFSHQLLSSSDADPLLKGSTPVHRFSSLHSASVLLLFLLFSLSLLLSDLLPSLLPLPHDLFFALASAAFILQSSSSSSAASFQISDLQAKCDSVFALVSALSSLACLAFACSPRLFVVDIALGASIYLQGLWSLQTGFSLYVEAFIPEQIGLSLSLSFSLLPVSLFCRDYGQDVSNFVLCVETQLGNS